MHAELRAGMRVALLVSQAQEEGTSTILALSSIVEDILDEDFILIQTPMYRGFNYPMPREPVLMRFLIEEMPWAVPVLFEERVKKEQFLLLKLRRLGEVERYQQREHFRLECFLPTQVERLAQNPGQKNQVSKPSECTMLNLSEGGALLALQEDINAGDKLLLHFNIGGQETMEALVLRVDEFRQGKFRCKAGVKFKHSYKSQPGKIYRFIMQTQIENMKRESKCTDE